MKVCWWTYCHCQKNWVQQFSDDRCTRTQLTV